MNNEAFRAYAVAIAGFKEQMKTWPTAKSDDSLEASLGIWLDCCRKQFNTDQLTVKQIELLNSILPGWYANEGLTWDHSATALSTYLLENGGMPKRTHWLYRWFVAQSGLAKCGYLEPRKIEWIQKHCLGMSDFGVMGSPLRKIS